DWLIDFGPEGGDAGGQLLFAGPTAEIVKHPSSHTGRALREYEAAIGSGFDTRSALSTAGVSAV
ncbi:MAG: hypothetical protein WBM28_14455, partial [Burkholderiales bacterium]